MRAYAMSEASAFVGFARNAALAADGMPQQQTLLLQVTVSPSTWCLCQWPGHAALAMLRAIFQASVICERKHFKPEY